MAEKARRVSSEIEIESMILAFEAERPYSTIMMVVHCSICSPKIPVELLVNVKIPRQGEKLCYPVYRLRI